jgi:hypothetical protein
MSFVLFAMIVQVTLALAKDGQQDSDTAASGDKKVQTPASRESPKGKTPPATEKASDETPFQITEKGSR